MKRVDEFSSSIGQLVYRQNSHHRIITSNMNIAVVHEKGISQFGESFARIVIVCGDGFFGEIAAGHDKSGER